METQCLQDDVAHELATGQLAGSQAALAHEHLDGCEPCRKWVGELARAETATVDTVSLRPHREQQPGDVLGTYELRRQVGAGGMSVVYAAFDRHLGRTVALKLLRPHLSSDQMKARLLREAQAMARLAHPNVLPIYEAREVDGALCIAMELVEGTTLRHWLASERRPLSEVLRVFCDAARGLAAAHAAGVVHRDFKPDNVLIGIDGRVRVTDFGLARWVDDASAPGDLSLTQSGTFVGTPVYMSPEHVPGGTVDARSDQFSFCVALYEGAAGKRPFTGANIEELAAAMRKGEMQKGRAMPGWLRRIVLKGLSPRPADRFASMDVLCAALVAGEQAWRRRRVLSAAVGATVALALAGWFMLLPRPPAVVTPLPAIQIALPAAVGAPQPEPVVVEQPPAPTPAPVVAKPAPKRAAAITLDTQSPYAR